ncbi:sugar phosphate isomerase/epimerase family protein [Reichenbachiella agariperforans]|uniref:sugar phosphate isomerase/epimerase family protein n=1 Tax=Reichenbachiella agariperforans TaxID=156994 RepID=UPI001C08E466|nr:sugar phosphate isomerase/epimerase [Reichenbachiella agariperforans]MBU2914440.1 sugar phosphate isomerase/epimerase [Reichenbachiella agariperforans]
MKNKTYRISTLMILTWVCVGLTFCSPKSESQETKKQDSPLDETPVETVQIGLQLYTVRDSMAVRPKETLERVAQLGYTQIELAGYDQGHFYGFEPKEFAEIAKGYGLLPVSAHISIDALRDNPQLAIASSKAAGLSYIVLPWLSDDQSKTIGQYQDHVELMNQVGRMCTDQGLKFAYHNHAFEFEEIDGQIPMDIIMEGTDPTHVKMELDLYWISKAGFDPVAYLQKYPGRFTMWHVKDMDDTADQNFAEVGNGTINYKAIFALRETSPIDYFFVEQDQSDDPFKSIETSIRYVKEVLLAE